MPHPQSKGRFSIFLGAIEISDSIQGTLDSFFEFLPNLIAFLVILVVGYFIAKFVGKLIQKGLESAGLDKQLHESDAGKYVEQVSPGASPSKGIGRVAFWIIIVFVLSTAIGALKIPAVTEFMNDVLAYLPNVIAAIVIFVIAAAIAGAAGAAVHKLLGDTPTGKVARAVIPALVMVIGIFMVLNQLKIAEDIVIIMFAVIMGSLGLGMALAFGLGGRDVAGKMLSDAYDKGRENQEDVKDDLRKGKERAEEQKDRAQSRVEDDPGTQRGGGAAPAY